MRKFFLIFVLLLLLASCTPTAITAGTIPQTHPIRRILFFGNSITMHPPSPIHDWAFQWGMAATQPDRDYVHRVQLGIAARQGIAPEIRTIRADIPWFPDGSGREITRFDPDLVIVQMGNNAEPTTPIETWRPLYQQIAQAATATGAYVIVVGLWDVAEDDPREVIVQQMAGEINASFVAIRDIFGPDTNGHADSAYTNSGVLWHPGDAGMALIAQRIYDALYERTVYVPLVIR